MTRADTVPLRVGHSPDPDDAFMVWALHAGVIPTDGFDVTLAPLDIQSLNERAVHGGAPLEVTALSAAAFARVTDHYWLLPHGASFGDGYGPIVVTRAPLAGGPEALDGLDILAPGELTTAAAALRLAAPGARLRHVPFDEILPSVAAGKADAGIVIHEGQLTYARSGVANHLDLGAWWKEETGLPLPLGINALRKNLGRAAGARANALLRASLEAGLARRPEALAYARGFGRGIALDDADRFVAMYVNDMTREMGERGRAAIETFLARAAEADLVPKGARVDMAPEHA